MYKKISKMKYLKKTRYNSSNTFFYISKKE